MVESDFITAFESCTLPFDHWTHRAHVKTAYLYLQRFPFEEAVNRVRIGIQRYNAASGVPEGPTSGYNETTTVAFMHIVNAVRVAYREAFPVASADEFCDAHPELMTRHILRLFYSPQRRSDPRAKTEFLPPDLAPLPAAAAQ